MPLFDQYNRIPNTSVPRLLEIGDSIIINGQVFDGATLSRKSNKLFEVYGDRDVLKGAVSSYNQVNLSTAMLNFGDRARLSSNTYNNYYIIDSLDSTIAYYVSGLASAVAFVYKINMTNWTIISQLSFATPAQAGAFKFVGQDATFVYGVGGNQFLHKIPKSMSPSITSTAWTTAGTTQKSTHLIYADTVGGNFVWYDTINAGIRSVLRTTYAQGWTATVTTLLAATTASTVQAEVRPSHPNASREFFVFCPKPSSANLGMYYNVGASDWTSLTTSNTEGTINWGAWSADTEVTTHGYGTATTIHTVYSAFISGTKLLVTRTNDDSIFTNATPQFNRWWIFDVTTPLAPVLLNTSRFANTPNYTTKFQEAPDGRFYSFASGLGLQFFVFNTTTNTLVESTFIPIPNATSYAFDSYGRLWYQLNDYSMYYTDNTTSYDVTLTLDNNAQQYVGVNLSNNLNVSTWNYAGARIATTVDLYVSGNAVFTSNGLKTIQISTNASNNVVVPITVSGTGQITFSAKPVI